MSADVAPIEVFDDLDSTNAEARRRAEVGERGPIWIVAREQTLGRGRRGRSWSTGRGNLAATLLMITSRAPADAARISFVAALAAADLASRFVPSKQVRVKWPNDLLIGDAKAGGVLVESGAASGGGLWLAVGFGINLSSAPVDVERPATALAAHLRSDRDTAPTADAAAAVLAQTFADRLTMWEREGFEAIAEAWTGRAAYLGVRCTVRLPAESAEGIAEALEPDGALRLRLDDGTTRRITAGDVFPAAQLATAVG